MQAAVSFHNLRHRAERAEAQINAGTSDKPLCAKALACLWWEIPASYAVRPITVRRRRDMAAPIPSNFVGREDYVMILKTTRRGD